MRILNVVGSLSKGGTERAAQNFCEGYFDLGHDSRMFAIKSGGIREEELSKKNIYCWIGNDSIQEIKDWKPQLVHYHKPSGVDIQLLLKSFSYATIVETNVFSKPDKFQNDIFASYQLSNWCKFKYTALGGSSKNSPVIPYPVKTKNFYKVERDKTVAFKQQYDIPQDTFVFGRIGQSFMGKWSLELIDVYTRFLKSIDQYAHLVVVNPPEEIVKYILRKKVQSNVTVIDKLTGDQSLRECYSCIDVFTHIAQQGESFGMVLAESLLCETPVITLNTPGRDNSQGEVIGNQLGGIPVDTLDEFYGAMVKLFQEDEQRALKGRNGRQHIINRYDYLNVCEMSIQCISQQKPVVQEFYEECLTQYCSSPFALFILKLMYKVRKKYFYLLCDLILRIYYRRF